jgi:hypothetical protein
MAFTLQQIRDYVRSYLDLDDTDLPDNLIDAWATEGSLLIERAEKRWPFYESTWSLNTTSGVAEYEITAALGSDVRELVSCTGPRYELHWISTDEANARWTVAADTSGDPLYWSTWGTTTITLWPTPTDAETFTFRGYRAPSDWVLDGAGGTPDFPADLHHALVAFVLARAYLQQEDEALGHENMRIFEASLSAFQRRMNDLPGNQPMVLNGRRTWNRGSYSLPDRLRLPWE